MTRKNKTIQKISKSNPHMAGIPCCSLQKYLDILIENNYTVIVYDQEDTDGKKKCRKLNKIYSMFFSYLCLIFFVSSFFWMQITYYGLRPIIPF